MLDSGSEQTYLLFCILRKEPVPLQFISRGFSVATRERPVLPTPSSASHSSSHLLHLPLVLEHLLHLPLRKCRLRHLSLGVESSIEGQPQLPARLWGSAERTAHLVGVKSRRSEGELCQWQQSQLSPSRENVHECSRGESLKAQYSHLFGIFSRRTMVAKQRTLIHSLPFSERKWWVIVVVLTHVLFIL